LINMRKDDRNWLIFIGIAIIVGRGAAEWFFVNVIIGSITHLFKILEWASKTSKMTPYLIVVTLLIIVLKQIISDYIQKHLRM